MIEVATSFNDAIDMAKILANLEDIYGKNLPEFSSSLTLTVGQCAENPSRSGGQVARKSADTDFLTSHARKI